MSNATTLRVPPHSLEAERAVLGALLIIGAPDRVEAAASRVGELGPCFYREGHRLVWDAIVGLAKRHEPVDVLTVANELKAAGHGDRITLAQIAALVDVVPSAANLDHFANVVRNLATARTVAGVAARIADAVYSLDWRDVPEYRMQAVAELTAAARTGDESQHDICHVTDLLPALVEAIETDPAAQKRRLVPYGFATLDKHLGGSVVGLVETFAADTGSGKSTLMLQMALHVAKSEPVLCITLEDSILNWTGRAVGQLSGVSSRAILFDGASIPTGQLADVTEAASVLSAGGLWFRKGKRPTLSSVLLTLAVAKAKLPDLRLVVIDYVQRISARDDGFRASDRVAELRHIMESLERAAEDLGLAIRAVAQMNRAGRKDKKTPPSTYDMRDSGALEEVAKRCTFLWRPDPADVDMAETGFHWPRDRTRVTADGAFFTVVKDGHGGRLGVLPLRWDGRHECYREAGQ